MPTLAELEDPTKRSEFSKRVTAMATVFQKLPDCRGQQYFDALNALSDEERRLIGYVND